MSRGILFQPDMVRQILAKKKRQTRRVIKSDWWRCLDPEDADDRAQALTMCPYGKPGDTLAVREAWRTEKQYDPYKPRDLPTFHRTWFEADGPSPPEFGRYRHARFMLMYRSRYHLALSSVRVEKVMDISESDAIAEGFESRAGFLSRWNEINGPGNPWCWVLGWG